MLKYAVVKADTIINACLHAAQILTGYAMKTSLTITRKVEIGYLVFILFAMVAVGYALFSLHEHNNRTEKLVDVQFRALTLLRDLRQNLLAHENLEGQLVILKDPKILELLDKQAVTEEMDANRIQMLRRMTQQQITLAKG